MKNPKKFSGETYRHRVRQQLESWVAGESFHNEIDDECCPDFSCCQPDLLVNEEMRKTYLAAHDAKDEKAKSGMLMGFLSSGLSKMGKGKDVYITDGSTNQDAIQN